MGPEPSRTRQRGQVSGTIQTLGRRTGPEHLNSRKGLNQFIDLSTLPLPLPLP
jgi:hypothetical protein